VSVLKKVTAFTTIKCKIWCSFHSSAGCSGLYFWPSFYAVVAGELGWPKVQLEVADLETQYAINRWQTEKAAGSDAFTDKRAVGQNAKIHNKALKRIP
jgi:chaperone required for assembly of F1-ATPase